MESARLELGNRSIVLPLVLSTQGPTGIDIGSLRRELGVVSLDSGLANTAESHSAITFIDGERGVLRYRGYAIEDLATHTTFPETAYLLLQGELPTPEQTVRFEADLASNRVPSDSVAKVVEGFAPETSPMHMLAAATLALGSQRRRKRNATDHNSFDEEAAYLIGALPTVIAWIYQRGANRPFGHPGANTDYCSDFLTTVFGTKEKADPVSIRALHGLLILHADHGQNCSTTAARLVGSSGADVFSSIGAAILALSGPKHGGANQEVIQLLERVRDDFDSPRSFVDSSKSSIGALRLPGFGHRVYKTFDPRAAYIRNVAAELLADLRASDSLLEVALELEQLALSDPYFLERRLYPNVDFYSGIIYRALGFPPSMFTPLFALGRLPGWLAHWHEHQMAGGRIYRPSQVYTGSSPRELPLQ